MSRGGGFQNRMQMIRAVGSHAMMTGAELVVRCWQEETQESGSFQMLRFPPSSPCSKCRVLLLRHHQQLPLCALGLHGGRVGTSRRRRTVMSRAHRIPARLLPLCPPTNSLSLSLGGARSFKMSFSNISSVCRRNMRPFFWRVCALELAQKRRDCRPLFFCCGGATVE